MVYIQGTEIGGVLVPYGLELAKILSRSIRGRNLRNRELLEIGKAVSAKVRQLLNPETKDGRPWYSGLEFEIEDARVSILFPWGGDYYDSKTGKEIKERT